jgi:hypothetical protein
MRLSAAPIRHPFAARRRQRPGRHPDAAATEIRQALAQCLFLLGDLTGAVEETHSAADAARATRSGRVRAQFGEPYPYTVGNSAARPVREARDRIRDLLST